MSSKKSISDQNSCAAVFERFCGIFSISQAEAARMIGMVPDTLYQTIRRGSVPYQAIVDNVPPDKLAYILAGQTSTAIPTVEQAISALASNGYRVTIERKD